ncbi:phiSA1p31-related protein [Streptomyces sp. or20]|uniref:phiSA1p31-related protein n=1 Tax=Streptomyces sp. or20 TaxID=1828016 RepID=UPI000BF13DDA|nr:phiSA1p31-related protein [Streptomyces sp. or20]
MSEFKVGDKVEHRWHGTLEVTYGPFTNTLGGISYLVRLGGREIPLPAETLTPPKPAFAVGDKVRYEGTLAELAGGPVIGATSGEELFLLKFLEGPDTGKGMARKASKLELVTEPALVPVGTRVRVDRAAYASEAHGMVGVITDNDADWTPSGGAHHPYRVKLGGGTRTIWAAEVTPVGDKPADGFEYGGIFYEYGVKYEDRDADEWRFNRSAVHGQPVSDASSVFEGESLAYAVTTYGPLIKQQ